MSESESATDQNIENQIFSAIEKNDTNLLKTLLAHKQNVNIFDVNSMTPLQHAAYKGNKEMIQLLLDQGANVNICQHEHGYTALHFGGLSGNIDVCSLLLLAGAKANVINAVGRTPSQMAAFVGNHSCVSVINNFVPKSEVEYYTISQTRDGRPPLPPFLIDSFHKFVTRVNIHPIRVTLNVQKYAGLVKHLEEVSDVLILMSSRQLKRGTDTNEVMAFKYYYLSCITREILKLQINVTSEKNGETNDKKVEASEFFIRKLLKVGKEGNLDHLDAFLREQIRNFPFHDSTIFRQMVATLAVNDPPSALNVITSIINGQRAFVDSIPSCDTCGNEKPSKKCSKCKVVQYCDRECQRLHWFIHKKACTRLSQTVVSLNKPDTATITEDMQKIFVNN